ncbi:hypothetical protein AB0G32_33585 [Streptomyces sp. NPDC023723]|uniref:hypothetical protein n=1 Tax=Streptomyces sp. NPDC023723 TaxID=3154323 RepID=UPI0033F096F2
MVKAAHIIHGAWGVEAPAGVDQAVGLSAGGTRAFVLRAGDTVAYLSGTPDVPDAFLDAQLLKLRG